jgi:hypothetical protein
MLWRPIKQYGQSITWFRHVMAFASHRILCKYVVPKPLKKPKPSFYISTSKICSYSAWAKMLILSFSFKPSLIAHLLHNQCFISSYIIHWLKVHDHNTFLGLWIVKLILKMSIKKIYLECQNLKKFNGGINTKIGGDPRMFYLMLVHHHKVSVQ